MCGYGSHRTKCEYTKLTKTYLMFRFPRWPMLHFLLPWTPTFVRPWLTHWKRQAHSCYLPFHCFIVSLCASRPSSHDSKKEKLQTCSVQTYRNVKTRFVAETTEVSLLSAWGIEPQALAPACVQIAIWHLRIGLALHVMTLLLLPLHSNLVVACLFSL